MNRIRKTIQSLPSKKQYFELVGAMLSIPVLVTVILLNTTSLKNNEKSKTPTPTPATVVVTEKERVITQPPQIVNNENNNSGPSCKKEVGNVRITSPREDEVVSTNPVCFQIVTDDDSYCPVEYASRVDGGEWSDFSKNTVCVYNLKSGRHTVEVKVKSTESDEVVLLRRNFEVAGNTTATSPTPAVTSTP